MTRALFLIVLAACGTPVPATPPPPPPPPTVSAATTPSSDPAGPEPQAPQAECSFERAVACQSGAPGSACARDIPNLRPSAYPVPLAQFSALESARARQRTPNACCYVEFFTQLCD